MAGLSDGVGPLGSAGGGVRLRRRRRAGGAPARRARANSAGGRWTPAVGRVAGGARLAGVHRPEPRDRHHRISRLLGRDRLGGRPPASPTRHPLQERQCAHRQTRENWGCAKRNRGRPSWSGGVGPYGQGELERGVALSRLGAGDSAAACGQAGSGRAGPGIRAKARPGGAAQWPRLERRRRRHRPLARHFTGGCPI